MKSNVRCDGGRSARAGAASTFPSSPQGSGRARWMQAMLLWDKLAADAIKCPCMQRATEKAHIHAQHVTESDTQYGIKLRTKPCPRPEFFLTWPAKTQGLGRTCGAFGSGTSPFPPRCCPHDVPPSSIHCGVAHASHVSKRRANRGQGHGREGRTSARPPIGGIGQLACPTPRAPHVQWTLS